MGEGIEEVECGIGCIHVIDDVEVVTDVVVIVVVVVDGSEFVGDGR